MLSAYRGPATLDMNGTDVQGIADIALLADGWEGRFEADDVDEFGLFGGNWSLTFDEGKETTTVLVTGGVIGGKYVTFTGSGPWPLAN